MIEAILQVVTMTYGAILIYLSTEHDKDTLLIIGNIWLATSVIIGVLQ